MEIYQLRYFIAVAETGNFTRAAARSNISQPSLSQQIINLEEELGQILFNRMGRKATLTDAGNLLLERARRIVAEADNTVRELKLDPSLGYRVAVGAPQTIAHFFFPAVVAYCRANDIKLRLRSFEHFRPYIVNAVLDGELDWGLVNTPITESRLESTTLFSEPLLLAVGNSHPLASAEKVTFADLRDQNFILLGDSSSVTAQVRKLSGDYDFEPVISHRCAQLYTVKTLTAMGLGVSILPASARNANDPAGLTYRKFSGASPMREIALIRHYRRHLSKGAKLFAEAAKAVIGPGPAKTDPGHSTPPLPPVGST